MNRLTFVQHRRKREGKTNYKKRLTLLKSRKPRLVIRKTNKSIIAQVVEYLPSGDHIICGINSGCLRKEGWQYSTKNIPACYLTGIMLAKKLKEKPAKKEKGEEQELILDIGLQTSVKGSRIYAVVKGMIDNNVTVLCAAEVFPNPERIQGKHILTYHSTNKEQHSTKDMNAFESTFNQILKKFTA
ncbi:MAG: 50S ribosomal protein L18 [Nanoarchaeota archaeon]